MSFLEEIRSKKQNLIHSKTVLKSVDGKVYEEDIVKGSQEYKYSSCGYVIDNKPDLSVAEVLPGLLMGSQDVTQSHSLLANHQVTHILSLGIEISKLEGLSYYFINILDLPESNILDIFDQCFHIINAVRKEGKHIYVHCNAGVSRSAAIVIGYLMKECNMKFKDAYEFLKKIRPCIKPNDGFTKQLLLYEQSLKIN